MRPRHASKGPFFGVREFFNVLVRIGFFLFFVGALGAEERWRVGADLLYLYPSIEQSCFVTSSSAPSQPNGTSFYNAIGFHPGVSISGEYRPFRVHWSYLYGASKKLIFGPYLFPTSGFGAFTITPGFEGSAKSCISILYQNAELLYAQRVTDSISLCAGLNCSYFDTHENVNYNKADEPFALSKLLFKSQIWGVGPEIALDAVYSIYQDILSFTAYTSCSLLVDRAHVVLSEVSPSVNPAGTFDIVGQRSWDLMPIWYMRLGIEVKRSQLDLSLGYECLIAQNAILNILVDAVEDPYQQYRNFSTQGPFFSLGVNY